MSYAHGDGNDDDVGDDVDVVVDENDCDVVVDALVDDDAVETTTIMQMI